MASKNVDNICRSIINSTNNLIISLNKNTNSYNSLFRLKSIEMNKFKKIILESDFHLLFVRIPALRKELSF